LRVGTSIVVEGDSEPIFEVDDVEAGRNEIGGWPCLGRAGAVTDTGHRVAASGLAWFVSAATMRAQ
jgi:hypothetical protein